MFDIHRTTDCREASMKETARTERQDAASVARYILALAVR
jgi:hypothetical protein